MKNTLWLLFGEIIGRILKLAIVVFATRQLGVEGWGVFSYALAFVSFFYVLGDFGINTFITREMSKDNASKYTYLSTSIILKLSLLFIFFVASIIIAPHFGKIKLGLRIIAALSLLAFSDAVREFALSINRSLQKMEREAFSKILMNTIITVLGIVLLVRHADPLSLAIAYTTGSITASIFVLWSIRHEFHKIEWKFSKKDLKIIYDFSWPLIIISLFSFVFSIDSIMLGQMRSAVDVGLYSAAQRLVQFTLIIPSFIAMSVFPILSKHESDTEKSSYIFEKIMVIIFALGLPIVIGGFLLQQKIIVLVFGQAYISGALTFGILLLSLLASFPNIILSNAIFAKNLQKIFIFTTCVGVTINIILNILLIPRYGAAGAATSLTITQLFITLLNWKKFKQFLHFSVMTKLGKICIANILLALVIFLCMTTGFEFISIVLIAIGFYIAILYILKEPVFTELLSLVKND